jgi:flavin-binding protein dodecin
MNRASFYASVTFAGIALLGTSLASATTVQKFTMQELSKKSDSIVMAKVEDQSSRQDAGNKEIYTYITLSVLESVKGAKGEKTMTIRQLGGSVGNLISVVPGMPNFKNGEEVVLFLSAKDREGYPWVMGLQQGKYSIVTDDNGFKHVRNELDGLRMLSPDGSMSDSKVSSEQPLGAFLDGIKSDLNIDGKVKVDPSNPTPIR